MDKMLLKTTTTAAATTTVTAASSSIFSLSKPSLSLSKLPLFKPHNYPNTTKKSSTFLSSTRMSWLNKLGFSTRNPTDSPADSASSIAQGPDDDIPAPGQEFAQFGAGCFWGVELAYQRVPGVTKTEVGYTQGYLHNPSYEDVCSGTSNHSEVVRVQYDPKECSYETLLDLFWARHDPTTLNRQVSPFFIFSTYFVGLG